jgi:hypothetical protein
LAKDPSTALSQEAEVGVKWKYASGDDRLPVEGIAVDGVHQVDSGHDEGSGSG